MFTNTTTTTSTEYTFLEYPLRSLNFVMDTRKIPPNCPRCASSNTKFCYYNNYTFSQPRYFCKACRRHWTKGGALRKVPVGGAHRNYRSSKPARQCEATRHPVPALNLGPTIESATSIDIDNVFANTVNHNFDNGAFTNPTTSTAPSSQIEDSVMVEYQKPFDLISGFNGDDQLKRVLDQLFMDEDIDYQDFTYKNRDDLDVHGIIGDELASDILWPEVTYLPTFGSQQTAIQMQHSEMCLLDDQPITTSNVVDDLGSFDLSGCEIFTIP